MPERSKDRSGIIRVCDYRLKRVQFFLKNGVIKVIFDPSEGASNNQRRLANTGDVVFPKLTSPTQQMEFLRRDPDALAIDFVRYRIKCTSCKTFVLFALQEAEFPVLDSWFGHKLTCGALQRVYEKELVLQNAIKPDPASKLRTSSVDRPDSRNKTKTALLRLERGGLREISQHISVITASRDGSREDSLQTPYIFVTDGRIKTKADRIRLIKNDPDISKVDWGMNALWCDACGKKITFRRDIVPDTWMEHKVRCKSLQKKLAEELKRPGSVRGDLWAIVNNDAAPDRQSEVTVALLSQEVDTPESEPANPRTAKRKRTGNLEAVVDPSASQVKRSRNDDEPCSSPRVRTRAADLYDSAVSFLSAAGDILSLIF